MILEDLVSRPRTRLSHTSSLVSGLSLANGQLFFETLFAFQLPTHIERFGYVHQISDLYEVLHTGIPSPRVVFFAKIMFISENELQIVEHRACSLRIDHMIWTLSIPEKSLDRGTCCIIETSPCSLCADDLIQVLRGIKKSSFDRFMIPRQSIIIKDALRGNSSMDADVGR